MKKCVEVTVICASNFLLSKTNSNRLKIVKMEQNVILNVRSFN